MSDRSHREHDVRDTSIHTYYDLELGDMQRIVLSFIEEQTKKSSFPTDREIALGLGLNDPNAVRPRRFELMKLGLIEEAGKRVCRVTKRVALTWRRKNEKPLFRELQDGSLQQLFMLEREDWDVLQGRMKKRGYSYVGSCLWRKEGLMR